jgi:integrase
MRGHIETRPNGRRYPIAELGRDPDTGKRVRKSMGGFKRYKDADRALRDALAKADAGKNPFPDDVLFRSYAESVIASRELHGRLRETTASRYRSLLRLYVLPSLGTMKLRDIRPTHVRLVIDGMQQRGQSPRSITQARAVVSMILKQAVADELLDANPCAAVSRPKAKNPNKAIPDGPQVHVFLDAASDSPYALPLLLAATTGMRRSEVLGLQWANVDLKTGRVNVRHGLHWLPGQARVRISRTEVGNVTSHDRIVASRR